MPDAPAPVTPGKPTPASVLTMPLGDSGLRAYGGYLNEEFLRQLTGAQGRRIYREMSENDATIGAILEAITALVCGVEWTVTAANDDASGEDAKKFVEEVFDDMDTPLRDVIAEACTMFPFGFAPMEITYKRRAGRKNADKRLRSKFDDGKIGLREIALRSQSTISKWEIDNETGELLGIWQQATWKGTVFIPIDKVALFRTQSVKNSPEGRSILRRVYRSWFFKVKIEEIEAIGVERDLAGLPVARIPSEYLDPNADPAMRAVALAWQRIVSQLRRESREGIVIQSDIFGQNEAGTGQRKFDLQLLNSGGARSFNTTEIIDRWDRKIATAVLADFIFLGQQSVGSFALSSNKTALFAQVVGAYVKRIADVLNRQIIERLWELNDFDPDDMPTMTPGDIETPDLNELGGFLSTLVGAGAQLFPDRELENHLRKLAGIPLMSEEDGLDDQGAPGAANDAEGGEDDWALEADADEKSKAKSVAKGGAHAALMRLKQAFGDVA